MNVLASLASVLLSCTSALATNWYVSPCGQDFWAGVQPGCVGLLGPKRTIQAAINAAVNGDTINVLPGTYTGQIDLNGKAITIIGTGGAAATILDGQLNGPVITCNSFEGPGTILQALTIRDGHAAQSGGGMLIALASPTIIGCVIEDNHAVVGGAGIACIAASPTISGCDFVDNVSTNSPGEGGAISILAGSPDITGCTFTGNEATTSGGAIFIEQGATPTIAGCTFEQNRSYTVCVAAGCGPTYMGSVVRSDDSNPEFEDCTFHDNRVDDRGAVAIIGGSAVFVDCTFTANHDPAGFFAGTEGGALAVLDGATATLTGCDFGSNSAETSGGAIFVSESTLSATLCTFAENLAQTEDGGAIRADSASVSLTDCTFSENSAFTSGGAISAHHCATISLDSCDFELNAILDPDAFDGGGAVNVRGWGMNATDCTFTANSSVGHGGAVRFDYETQDAAEPGAQTVAEFDGCTFTGNSAVNGGGLRTEQGTVRVQDCVFQSNVCTNVGAGFNAHGQGADVRVLDSQFLSNIAAGGAGMCASNDAVFVRCLFSGNSAERGAGAYGISGFSHPTMLSCRFTGNVASGEGAAAYVGAGGEISLVNCQVYGNTSPAGEGAIADGELSPAIYLINTLVHNNSGGGVSISNLQTIAIIRNTIVRSNPNGGSFPDLTPDVQYSNIDGGAPGTGNIDANPLWAAPAIGNFNLHALSPCIDAGVNWALPQDSVDLDGDGDFTELLPVDYDGDPRLTDNPNRADTGCGSLAVVDMGPLEFAGEGDFEFKLGDANGDGFVDFNDILYVLANWGTCPSACCSADVNRNDLVDFADILLILANFGA